MERELLSCVMRAVREASVGHRQRQRLFNDQAIVITFLFAVLSDRPVLWATRLSSWPGYLRLKSRPSASTMSRRLRSPSVLELLERVRERLPARLAQDTALIIDAKPLPVGGYSGDREAKSGRACGGFARGYKLYLVIDERSGIHAWDVHSMNVAEQVVAKELIPRAARSAGPGRWLLGDRLYDSNDLHDLAESCGLKLLTERMRTKDTIGPRQSPGRARAIAMLERPGTKEGRALLARRDSIERFLGTFSCTGGGLGPLPGFVRGLHRVKLWVGAKLLIHSLRTARKHAAAA
jgi:hypothetical protein